MLFVDDEPLMLRSVTRALGHRFALTTAASGQEALNLLLAGRRYDAIVSDVWMAGLDGQQFYEAVRAFAPTQAERLVFLTGGGLPTRLVNFLADHTVIEKPFADETLAETIESIAGRRMSITSWVPVARAERPSRVGQ